MRIAPATTTAERLRIAIGLYIETIDEYAGAPGQASLIQAWAEADREPGVRDMLARRRERLVGAAQMLLHQGVARRRVAGLDGRGRGEPRVPRPPGRPAAPAHRSRRRLSPGRAGAPGRAILELMLAAATADRPAAREVARTA